MSWLELGQMIGHGFAKLTGAQRAEGATAPVAARGDGSLVLPDGTAPTKGSVGLGDVDNTSDANKPVSIATAAALATKEATANKGAPNGYASLDADGKVSAAQLPSFVDDVIEVDTLPVTGESGKIYVTLGDGKTWRWGGTAYAEISASPGSSDAVPEGVSNLYHTATRVRDTILSGFSAASSAVVTAADSVLTAFGKLQAQVSNKLDAVNPSYTGTLTGGTGVVNLGSGQFVKDASGNVGIGTASPTSKISIASPGLTAATGLTAGTSLIYDTSAALNRFATLDFAHSAVGTTPIARISSEVTSSGTFLRLGTTNDFGVGVKNSAVVIDPSGNFGLGVTPSAWAGGGNLQIAAGGMVAASSSYSSYGANFYYGSGAHRYITDGPATMERHDNGTISWQLAPSGTTGTPISFTEVMKLDEDGNLKLAGKYHTRRSTGALDLPVLCYSDGISGAVLTGDVGDKIAIGNAGAGELLFVVNNSTVGQFDSSGNLLVGTTNNIWGARSVHVTSGSQPALVVANPDTASPSNILLWCHAAGLDRLIIYGNGNVLNSNNSYGGFSDAKLKENITDVSPKLAKLMQVRIVNYNLKSDPDKTKLLGVVAQELEQVIPGMVEETADRDAEGNDLGTTTKSVKYSVFVPMLIKGLQEQQAQIAALMARVAALEAAQAV